MTAAISFERVSKSYRGGRGYRSLRDEFAGVATTIFRRSRPRASIQALREVSFDVPEGQAFGLIGMNGAGKTTALKIATRIAYPTSGRVRVRGRVGALIEVGTGMHPELTGRENVHLYGRILGLTRSDIQRRFADIVEFAGIERAIDQPVKQFSSGMQLRLGFSIAVHIEPDVLLVDEALAVGDAGFQYRCVERMTELVREGRTLVLVSHDMNAIETVCERAILLSSGVVVDDGPAPAVVRNYLLALQAQRLSEAARQETFGSELRIDRVAILDENDSEVNEVKTGGTLTIRLHYTAERRIQRPIFTVGLGDGRIGCFALASMLLDGETPEVIAGEGFVDCIFERLPLHPRAYEIWCDVVGQAGTGNLVDWQRMRLFEVVDDQAAAGKGATNVTLIEAPVKLPYRWRARAASEAS